MPKKYYYRRNYGARDKYSIEQTAGSLTINANTQDGYIVVVPPADLQGMRKVKHISIQMADRLAGTQNVTNLTWAIVYAPAGMTPNILMPNGAQSLYEPNQYVMSCGVFDFSAGPLRISSPLARNLNSGDQIVLVVKQNPVSESNRTYDFVVKYAVTLQ